MNNRVRLLLLFLISAGWAAGQSFSVNVVSTQPVAVMPGETTNLLLKIYNNNTSSIDITQDFVKQEYVSCITCDQIIHVEPKSEKTFSFALFTGINTPPGILKIKYKLAEKGSLLQELEIALDIKRKTNFSLTMINAPGFVKRGYPILAKAIIQNKGNVISDFTIVKVGFSDTKSKIIILKPAEIYYYDIAIKTDSNQSTPISITYGLKVLSNVLSQTDNIKKKEVFHTVSLIPLGETKPEGETKRDQPDIKFKNLTISIISKQPLAVIPGEISTVVLKIHNNGRAAVDITPQFAKQENVSCIMCNQILHIEPKGEKTFILPVLIAKNTPPGILKTKYQLKIKDSIVAEPEIFMEIEKKVQFSLAMINAPEFVRGGDKIIAKAIIQNNGNIESDYTILKFGFSDKNSNVITLKPGEIYHYDIVINTNPNQAKSDFITYGIKVLSPVDTSKKKDIFHSTYIFPVAEAKKSQYHSIPGYIKLNYLISDQNNSSASGYQVEAFFKGSLDPANKHRVELFLRGPNRFSSSVLGMYDEYYFNYTHKNYYAHVGDKVYMLTPLTELSRFARGIELSRTKQNFTIGGFYIVPRFNSSIKNEYAGYASYLFNKFRLSVNHLSKLNTLDTKYSKTNSIMGTYTHKETFLLETEISRSSYKGVSDMGYRSLLNYKRSDFYVNVSTIITGRNYEGYYKNTTYYLVNSLYNLNKKTDLNFNYNKDYQTPQLDSIMRIAPSNTSYFIGFTRRMNKNMSTRLLYRSVSVYDRSELKSFSYKSNQLQLTVNQRLKKFGYMFMGDFGYNRNLLISEDSNLSRFTSIYTELQFFPVKNFYLSVFQNYLNSNRYSFKNEMNVLYGGSLFWLVNKALNISLRYQSNYFPEDYYRNRDAFDLRINYKTTKRLDFSFAARYIYIAQQSDAKELFMQFGCNYKINLPVKKIASYGKVYGMVYTKTGKPVRDIILHLNGRTALTRKDGSFVFNNVPQGSYFLFVDQASLNLNEIIEQVIPVKIDVVENKTTTVNLDIINAAKISGHVSVYFKKGAYYDDTTLTAIPSVVLILKSENESLTIVSGEDGKFAFNNIKPGRWNLQVYDNLLDNKYILEKEQYTLDLEAGQTLHLPIKIIRKGKKIHFIQPPITPKK